MQAKVPCSKEGARGTHLGFALRIGNINWKWTKECESVEEIRDMMNTEQLLEVLIPCLRMWVWDRKPTTGIEADKVADEYIETRKSSYGARE